MTGKALLGGLKRYATWLVVTLLFPLLWLKALRLARRHTEGDARGPMKVGAAIVISIVILAGGFLVLTKFQDRATEGMYDSLDTRMAIATGESAYQEAVTLRDQTLPGQIETIRDVIAEQQAAGNNTTKLEATLAKAEEALVLNTEIAETLGPNHQLYLGIEPDIQGRDDAAVKAAVAARSGFTDPTGMDFDDRMEGRTARAFEIKDKAMADMQSFFLWFLYPSLVGAFFAPMAFVLGSILRTAFVESSSVGYKPYPGKAAGLFLLFGAFGVPSIPFAAWTFMDMERRSVEGQISL